MKEFFAVQLADLIIVGVVTALLLRFRRITLHPGWLTLLLFLYAAYFLALIFGANLLPLREWWPDLQWNWGGKLVAILLWVMILHGLRTWKPGFVVADAGFTLRQHPGSLKPALMMILFIVLFQLLLEYLSNDGSHTDTETLLFQLTMPGLDEEPMFRGVLLYIAGLALAGPRFAVLGARMNWAGLLLVLLFGLVHGIALQQGSWHVSPLVILVSGFQGLVLLWLRERTGSLVLPIVAHNLVNFAGMLL